MKVENYQQYLTQYLIVEYGVKPILAPRYARMLVNRAVRFYIDGHLDQSTVAEDLYQGDDFSCDCTQEQANIGIHGKGCEYSDQNHFPNLEFSESEDKKELKERTTTLERIIKDYSN